MSSRAELVAEPSTQPSDQPAARRGPTLSLAVRVAGAAALAALAGCSGPEPAGPGARPPGPSGASTPSAVEGDGAADGTSGEPTEVTTEECAPGPGRTVRQLRDLLVPAVRVPAVVGDDEDVIVDAVTLQATVIDAGCVIRYEAPGGCLGAVEITAATIPAVTIPAVEVEGRSYPAVTEPAVSVPAARTPQVCRVESDGELVGVTRAGVVRPGFSRNGLARPGDDLVPTVRLEPVRLPDVDVDPERLSSRPLPGADDVEVLDGDRRTAFVAPARVLFDSDRAEIRPEAADALRRIAERIQQIAPGRRLLVQGHTDDRGDAAYGQDLSERRADAVAEWLVRQGGIDRDLITTRGFGETAPVVPNTSDANRQRNRRVVVVVLPG